jgi:hypothetical protein
MMSRQAAPVSEYGVRPASDQPLKTRTVARMPSRGRKVTVGQGGADRWSAKV